MMLSVKHLNQTLSCKKKMKQRNHLAMFKINRSYTAIPFRAFPFFHFPFSAKSVNIYNSFFAKTRDILAYTDDSPRSAHWTLHARHTARTTRCTIVAIEIVIQK